ncbi:glycosyltransferase family 2 protein [Acinetobacter terrae]|uniref:Glycosyltransferase n=1 Tax=Acinetobacter terrae TaxID=2731247 RepID=A0A8E4GME4_9GAMM|nr:glycosyltransferase [Acinetobacter terrae]NNH38956.1 glycosyltransferase [Acinetobacter terrae]
MTTPLVSVIIACYNHEKFVQDSILSVINQSYKNIELIVIDDGSKDSSVERIKEMILLCEQRFTRFEFRNRPNKGLSATLNEALEWCKGEYLSPQDSDDIMLPNKIEKQVKLLSDNKKIVAVSGSIYLIDEENKNIGEERIIELHLYDFKSIILNEHRIFCPAQMIRAVHLKKIGGYKDGLIIEDWYMWLKLAEIGDLLVVPDFFAKYRQHDNNTIKQLDKMHRGRLDVLSFFKDSPYYEKALRNVYWINCLELAAKSNYEIKYILKLFLIDPKRLVIDFFKKAHVLKKIFLSKILKLAN